MTAGSPVFMGCMVAVVATYWVVPVSWRRWIPVLGTVGLLLVGAPESLPYLTALSLLTYGFARRPTPSNAALFLPLGAIVALFGFLKLGAGGFMNPHEFNAVPLGFSYYTLRCIHVILERFKGTLPPPRFDLFFPYMFFAPTIVCGPIHRIDRFERSLRRQRWNVDAFSAGLERILYGYAKIILLGNAIVVGLGDLLLDTIDPANIALLQYARCVQYGLNLYAQFAGHSDLAIGVSQLIGFQIMENFQSPFIKPNIGQFWNSWHKSLSDWCRLYVYEPALAVTRSGGISVIASMVVLGLWHGFNMENLVWGAYHGIGIVVWHNFRLFRQRLNVTPSPALRVIGQCAAWALTFNFVMLGFAFPLERSAVGGFRLIGEILGGVF